MLQRSNRNLSIHEGVEAVRSHISFASSGARRVKSPVFQTNLYNLGPDVNSCCLTAGKDATDSMFSLKLLKESSKKRELRCARTFDPKR
jgi:hypothetical protein